MTFGVMSQRSETEKKSSTFQKNKKGITFLSVEDAAFLLVFNRSAVER